MTYIVTMPEKGVWLKQCQCGKYPEVIRPNYDYSDLWIKCKCGRRTPNAGGFHYAREIPVSEALETAAAFWTLDNVYMENEE